MFILTLNGDAIIFLKTMWIIVINGLKGCG